MNDTTREIRLSALVRLANECAWDDERATKAPWIWTDELFLWNVEIDRGVLDHGASWPMSPDNREVIARSRNRLPELAAVLREAARDHEHLRRLYADSRDYVAALEGERDDLVAAAQRHVDEVNQLDSRLDELETALAEALAEWEASEYRGKREHLTRLPQLRDVLVGKKRRGQELSKLGAASE